MCITFANRAVGRYNLVLKSLECAKVTLVCITITKEGARVVFLCIMITGER